MLSNKPLQAAFRLGYFAKVVRIVPHLCGDHLEGIEAELIALADRINPNIYMELQHTLTTLQALKSTSFAQEDNLSLLLQCPTHMPWSERDVKLEGAQEVRRWQMLSSSFSSTSSRAIPEESPLRCWYECGGWLGETVASIEEREGGIGPFEEFQKRLRRLPTKFLKDNRWLKVVSQADVSRTHAIDVVATIGKCITEQIPIEQVPLDLDAVDLRTFVVYGVFVEMCNALGRYGEGPTGEVNESLTARMDVFVPTPLQAAILEALKGRNLTKDRLAAEVCGGEGSRLYRPRGIRELMERGLVKHKNSVGYYRPDYPPAGAINLAELKPH